jgi:ankyrin repeat protein
MDAPAAPESTQDVDADLITAMAAARPTQDIARDDHDADSMVMDAALAENRERDDDDDDVEFVSSTTATAPPTHAADAAAAAAAADAAATASAVDLDIPRFVLDCDEMGRTPLHIVAERGHLRMVEGLASMGACLFALDIRRNNPLHLAMRGGHIDVVAFFIRAMPRLALDRDGHGRSPLMLAAMYGHTDILRMLIQQIGSAMVNAVDVDGNTALHLAYQHGSPSAKRLLICQTGISTTIRNKRGKLPVDMQEEGAELKRQRL